MTKLQWNISEKLQNGLELHTGTQIPEIYNRLFCKATELIEPFVTPKKIVAFFVRDVLTMRLTAEGRIAEWMPNVIIYNLSKIDEVKDERNVMVVFLEELVHAYFCSHDEDFVGEKVAEIYPEITFNRIKHKYEFSKI